MLSDKTIEIIYGELLGDGTLTLNGKNARFDYGTSNLEYAQYLAGILYEIHPSKIKLYLGKPKQNGELKQHYRWYSINMPELTEIRNIWYPNDKKIIPENIKLTPTVCLHWYVGDGCLCDVKYKNNNSQRMRISTDSFSIKDQEFLLKKLYDINIEGDLQIHVRNKNLYNINIKTKSMKKFLDYIGGYPVQSYKHKWNLNEYYNIYDYQYSSLDMDRILMLPRGTLSVWVKNKWFKSADIDFITYNKRYRFSDVSIKQLVELRNIKLGV